MHAVRICSLAPRWERGGISWRLLFCVLACAVRRTSTDIVVADVHRMVRNLGKHLLEQECTVLGSRNGPECAVFNRSAFPSPNKLVASMSGDTNTDSLLVLDEIQPFKLMNQWLTGGKDTKIPLLLQDGGIQKVFNEQASLIESLAKGLEEAYFTFDQPSPNFSPSSLFNESVSGPKQTNWQAAYRQDGRFQGRYVDEERCAFHFPTTHKLDKRRTDPDVLRLNEVCALMRAHGTTYKNSGLTFQYASSVNGVTMDFPASIRGLDFDNRYEVWFKETLTPPKDIVIVVDHSGSMDPTAPCGALKLVEKQVRALFQTLLTERDRVQLILTGDSPDTSPCFNNKLVPGTASNLDALLDWFFTASRRRGGTGKISSGVLEALSIMQDAKEGGYSTNGARFLIVMTDGIEVEDILDQGLTEFKRVSNAKEPFRDLHVIGVALTRSDRGIQARTPIDKAACSHHGLVWKVIVPQNSTDKQFCSRTTVNISTADGTKTFETDPIFLMNSSALVALAAFPFSVPSDQGGLSSLSWQNLRKDILRVNDTKYRRVLSVSKVYFDKRFDPPKAAGVAHADFLAEDFILAFNSIDVPALTHISIIKHEGDIGHVIAHNSAPPDYSDYVGNLERNGDYNINIVDIEGPSFKSEGVLDALVQQEQGSKTVQRKLVVDMEWSLERDTKMEHLVREEEKTVSYFWKRIPKTPFTLLMSVLGTPTGKSETVILTPKLKNPKPCNSDQLMMNESGVWLKTDTCWNHAYPSFPSVYHRLDLLSGSNMPARFSPPFGGPSVCGCTWCTYDTSTWLSTSASFVSVQKYLEQPLTQEKIVNINKQMLSEGDTVENELGGGLRQGAMNALKITSSMEAYWKDVMGVQGVDSVGNAASMDATKSQIRRDVLQLFFTTSTGISRMYPGTMAPVPRDYNAKREACYTRAVSHPDHMTISQPYLPNVLKSTTWTISFCKALFHSPNSTISQIRRDPFGVVGVHYRLDAFVNHFRKATTLRDILKFGCGDMGTSKLADRELGCFLLNENAEVLLDRHIMTLKGDQGIAPSTRKFNIIEPLLMQQLLESDVFEIEILNFGSQRHVAYKVNETTLETFTASKRAAAKAAGGPVSDLIGIDILKSVKSFSGMTLNYIWFYQVPHSKMYLLVVRGYRQLNREYFCGSLSLYCPSVTELVETTIPKSVCNVSYPGPVSNKAGYNYEGPTVHQLRLLDQSILLEGDYILKCPFIFQMWTIGLLVAGGLLVIVATILLVIWVLRRTRRRLAAARATKQGKMQSQTEQIDDSKQTSQENKMPLADTTGAKFARVEDYQKIVSRQWQFAENLMKRDGGDSSGMFGQISAAREDIQQSFEHLDYLQQRVFKLEALDPRSCKLHRNVRAVENHAYGMLNELDSLKSEGHFPGLDPALEEDTATLRSSLGSKAFPAGTREALFHKINHPHLVERKLRVPGDNSLSVAIDREKSSRQSSNLSQRANGNKGANGHGPDQDS